MHPARSGTFAISSPDDPALLRRELERDLGTVRRRLRRLTAPLDDDTMHHQHLSIMSHVYNPFENPRWVRGDLGILPRVEAGTYLADVRAEALEVLRTVELGHERPLLAGGYVYRMIVQHEAQHQETMLQALDLRGTTAGRAAAAPYPPAAARRLPALARPVDDTERVAVAAGPFRMGTDDRSSAYDNERPSHLVQVPAFAVDRFPVTARRFAAFIADRGYARPELWSRAGRAWLAETGERAPQGWVPDGSGGWLVRRFGHLGPLDPREPVQHVSYFEAEAFARWSGGRLPTEAEWEKAAAHDPAAQRSRTWPWGEAPPGPEHANLDHAGRGPAPVGSFPAGASAYGVEQLLGDVYEWTSSPFAAYPGYATFPYPEYSEVFFGDDYRVLRGASWATAGWVARSTFRNWDYPRRRQLFAGLRLAWDLA